MGKILCVGTYSTDDPTRATMPFIAAAGAVVAGTLTGCGAGGGALPAGDLGSDPGGDGPPAEDTPPGSLWQGLMDPGIKPFMFKLIQGWEMEVANTPAVHPQTGRIYITAAGVEPGSGLLVGIDVHDDHLEIAFQTDMGGGSGTSPAVSHDGEQVYAATAGWTGLVARLIQYFA